jgi:hypothetical protein
MVQLRSQRAGAGLNVAQAFAIGQLREGHGQIPTPAGSGCASWLALITRYAATKLAIRKKGNQSLKDGVPLVHAPSSVIGAYAPKKQRTSQISERINTP